MKLKHLSLAPAAVLALGLCVSATQKAMADDVLLTGNTLLVGVNNGGSIIPNSGPFVGIQYDSTGTGNYGAGYDFITPGDPYQYFAVGVDGNYAGSSYADSTSLAGMNTTNTSSGTTLQATSTGGSYDGLGVSQTLTFQQSGAGSGVIDYSVQLTNLTDATLDNVAYSTGLDPDQDVYFDGNYATANTIVNSGYIYATGTGTAWTIGIANNSSYASTDFIATGGDGNTPAAFGWDIGADRNPYNGTSYGQTSGSDYGDYSINMDWLLGNIGVGQTVTLNYEYVIAATPAAASSVVSGAPDIASTLGLMGFVLAGLGAVRRKFKA